MLTSVDQAPPTPPPDQPSPTPTVTTTLVPGVPPSGQLPTTGASDYALIGGTAVLLLGVVIFWVSRRMART